MADLSSRVVADGRGQRRQTAPGFRPPCCPRCRWSCRPWNWQSIGELIGLGIAVERVGVGGGARRRDRLHGRNRLHRAARHLRLLSPARVAGSGAEAHALERLRVLPILGSHFHHDEVLVELVVNGRHGALAEGIVQHVVDLVRCKAVARPGGAIHVDEQLQAVLLQVRVDIRERGGVLAERGHEPRHPFIYRVWDRRWSACTDIRMRIGGRRCASPGMLADRAWRRTRH